MSEEVNKEESVWNGRVYTPRYVEVMEYAQDLAKGRDEPNFDDLVTVYDLLTAVCAVHPEAFSELLGQKCATFNYKDFIAEYYGDVNECSGAELHVVEQPPVRYSSEVDRYLSLYGGIMSKMLESFPSVDMKIDSLHIAGALLWDMTPGVKDMLNVNGIDYSQERIRSIVTDSLRRAYCKEQEKLAGARISEQMEKIGEIKAFLQKRCFGQDAAIEEIILQLSMFWTLSKEERGFKPLSLFLTGPTGCGKSHLINALQQAFSLILGISENEPIDFSRFSTEQTPIDLIGRDSGWKDGGHEGVLTLMAKKNPRGIIVVDNYEHGHPYAISYLDTALERGFLEDAYTQLNVYFSENIFIVSANATKFVDSTDFANLCKTTNSNPPQDKILEGVMRHYPAFGSTMRIADTIVLLRKHTVQSFIGIIRAHITQVVSRIKSVYGLEVNFHEEELVRLFVDIHTSVESAHPISSSIEELLFKSLQRLVMLDYGAFRKCKKINVLIDEFPCLDNTPGRDKFDTFEEWMAVYTEKRLLQAKRLRYQNSAKIDGDDLIVKITDLEYIVLPSIEDTKYFSVVVPDVSFEDLIGVELVRDRVSEIIDYYNGAIDSKVRPDTGMILYGPPGTGKTSVAKAIARELGVPFIMIVGSDFTKGVVGAGVEAVKELFAVARKYRAVVFIDEIDGIGSRDRESGENARIINALLTELDGFTERNMLVIGATNRYEALDEALLRPGRLSLKVQLGLLHKPDDRKKLVELCLKKADLTVSDEIVDSLVRTTAAWSPANIVAMVNGGIRIAQREKKNPEMRHFIQSRTTVLLGEDPQSVESSGSTAWYVAVHEAGHAVAAVLNNIPFVQATVSGNGNIKGFVERIADDEIYTSKKLIHHIDMLLAGRAAERLLAEPTDGVGADFARATQLAIRMVRLGLGGGNIVTLEDETAKEFLRNNREAVERLLHERMVAIENLLIKNKKGLNAVAKALMVQKVLFEADIRAIVDSKGGDDA